MKAQELGKIEETIVDIIEIMDTGHDKSFIKEHMWAARKLMTTMLEDDVVCKVFEPATTRVATSGPMFQEIVNKFVKNEKFVSPMAKFVAKHAKKKIRHAAQQLVLLAPLLLLPSSGESSRLNKYKNPRDPKVAAT